MHECSLGNAPLVNAEVDSMGGVFDSGVRFGVGLSSQRAAIEKAQADLRREYDVREKRKRELEFLEKGGNPLDFNFGNAESTSLTDQPPEPLVTSEAKGSFALTASPHGDSVESSGRPEARVVSEPNCADNLLLFDGKNDSVDGGRISIHFVRNKIAPSEQVTQMKSSQNAKESGESAVFGLPKSRAYKRRNRSRPNREGARSSSADIVSSRGDHASSLPSPSGQKDMNQSGLVSDSQQNQNISMNYNSKPTISNGTIAPDDLPSDGVVDMILDNGQVFESLTRPTEVGLPKLVVDDEKCLVTSQRSEGVAEEPSAVAFEIPESLDRRQLVVSPRQMNLPVSARSDNQNGSVQHNGFLDTKSDEKTVPNGQSCSAIVTRKSSDFEAFCTRTSLSLDGTSAMVPPNGLRDVDMKENAGEEILICPVSRSLESDENLKTNNENKADDSAAQDEQSSVCRSHRDASSFISQEVLRESGSGSQEEEKHTIIVEGMEIDGITASELERKPGNLSTSELDYAEENASSDRLGGSADKSAHDNRSTEKENADNSLQDPVPELLQQTAVLSRNSSDTNKHKISTTQLKLETRTREDSILKEARVIEAKRKRIAQLSVGSFTPESHQKSHWSFVLEEMAWLANDFAQERRWKISAAAQLSHRIVSTCRERLAEKRSSWRQKKVAHTLSKAIMDFWLSAEEMSKGKGMQCPKRNSVRGVQEYAVRYLKYNTSLIPLCLAEAPVTPERISDLGSQELSWEENFTEENLFYTVPPGAIETYRKAIESHLAQVEKTCRNIQEEVEASIFDAAAGTAFEEVEGETNTYLSSGDVENGKPSNFAPKKRNLILSSSARSYELGTDLPFKQRMENKFGTQQSGLTVKRPASNVHVSSIPTKRMRTASRPRFTAPFTAGTSSGIQVPNNADASSGDTNSFQDDQSTFHKVSQIPNNMEVESVADFGTQLPYDSAEVSKPKKKKQSKHLASSYEKRWQLENNFENDVGCYSRKRFDKLAESNGSSGLFGQHIMKKQKMIRQSVDNSFDTYSRFAGSIPSPVASQMSNMSNSNKLVKILGGHRGRKSKSLKMPVGQRGPGGPWSSFEEQALIVLVHDLGPNWELISDAINNILQYKCIFRKSKDCSEHHKELISRTAGDGADSAEDSGSSQAYPSTLPGIPKGSARALFQRLQEPIEEDMIKFHFDKIILMSRELQFNKMQNENQEQKPIQPHSSHALALSQVCPNNVNGGPVLTPLDLCDALAPSTDILSSGYQGTHGAGLGIPNHGNATSLHSTSGANSSVQGSPNVAYGNNFPSPSTPVNSSIRDGRYGGPKSTSIPVDEHQRVQQYNQMMPGRVSGTPLGTDRGGRIMAGGNNMGIMSGINRNMTVARPGFPGTATSSVLNSGNMLSLNMASMAGSAMHSGGGAGPGNSMMRPRESVNTMRPAQIQMPAATQGNIQGVPPFGGPGGGFSKQTSPPSSHTHPFHHQQKQQSHNSPHHPHLRGPNHVSSPQHQAYAIRFAKDRQLQLQQQQQQKRLQQQLAASSGTMPRGPSQSQPSLQNSSDAQPQNSASESSPLTPSSPSMPAMPQHQLKPHMPPHQMGKQRERQPQQQRPHPQQRAKLVKGHQNLTVDPSNLNGISLTTGRKFNEKAQHVINATPGEGLYSGSGPNSRQKLYVGQAKQAQQDDGNQGHASPSTSDTAFPAQKLATRSQPPVQRMVLQNRKSNSEGMGNKSLAEQGRSEQQNVSSSSSRQPSLEQDGAKPLTSLNRTQIKGPEDGQALVTLPTQQQQKTSSSPPQQEKQPLPAQQLQAGNSNL